MKAFKLKNLIIDRIDLVDKGANQHAHILIAKRDVSKSGPTLAQVHSDRPIGARKDDGTLELGDNDRRARVQAAAQEKWGDPKDSSKYAYVQDLVGTSAIIAREGALYKVTFTIDSKGQAVFDGDGDEVVATYTAFKRAIAAKGQTVNKKIDAFKKGFLALLAKLDGEADAGDDGVDKAAECMKAAYDAMGKAIESFGAGPHADDHPVHAMKASHEALGKQIEDAAKAKTPPAAKRADDVDETPVAKASREALEKRVEAAEKTANEATALAKSLVETAKTEEQTRVVKSFTRISTDVAKDVPLFKKLAETLSKAEYDRVVEVMRAADNALAASALFANVGSPREGSESAWGQIVAKADALLEKGDSKLTREQAIDKIMSLHPELVAKHREESRLSVQ